MKVTFSKKFDRQLEKITDAKTRKQISATIKIIIDAHQLGEIPAIKKLKGFSNAYRVRSGQYCIGLIRGADNIILIAAIDTRKDIYKHFP